jgi:hypothetical protein
MVETNPSDEEVDPYTTLYSDDEDVEQLRTVSQEDEVSTMMPATGAPSMGSHRTPVSSDGATRGNQAQCANNGMITRQKSVIGQGTPVQGQGQHSDDHHDPSPPVQGQGPPVQGQGLHGNNWAGQA